MLNLEKRTAILALVKEGHSLRSIAKALKVSPTTVKKVVEAGQAQVPRLDRDEQLLPYIDQVRQLSKVCDGNLVRVHEELAARHDVDVAYSTLTAFCRRHEIGESTKKRVGRYEFGPGQEMQHDTSPHTVVIDGHRRKVECASLVLCFSRMIFAQAFVRWRRFDAKVFLDEAIRCFGGAAEQCMLDNLSVIIAHGVGANAVTAAEMEAFSRRFDFEFVAHEPGDKDRSGRVERPHHFIEHNFYPGREFSSLTDLNAQLLEWCDRGNRKVRRHLKAAPIDLFAVEQPALKPLPLFIPAVYDVHTRRVDVEGYVNLHTNRYSAPTPLIGRSVQLHETRSHIRVFDGHQLVVEHDILNPGAERRATLEEHRHPGTRRARDHQPLQEEKVLRAAAPELSALADLLRQQHGGRAIRALRELYRLYLEYPTEPLTDAVRTALDYGLSDIRRIEAMVLRNVAGDFFNLPIEEDSDE